MKRLVSSITLAISLLSLVSGEKEKSFQVFLLAGQPIKTPLLLQWGWGGMIKLWLERLRQAISAKLSRKA